MSVSSFASANPEDQDRLLDEASGVVKEQAFFMKRAMDNDNLREVLKHASNMICELRTSLLSPKSYYELYMQVFQEMQELQNFFGDRDRHKRKMSELYESVQHAGNILPRLYLLVTVGGQYIKSKEMPAKEILMDMSDLCKGVQHPLRGLFLRYYLLQVCKDKLPDTGSEYEAAGGGNVHDAFEFLLTSLSEGNSLWVRMQHQGPAKDRARREKDRWDLRVLVASNLQRMSELDGMDVTFYQQVALPKILELILSVKETMSQQCLFECMIQVFPDDFQLQTLNLTLEAYGRAQPNVDMKPIMTGLMSRLATYLSSNEDNSAYAQIDIFSLFRTHLTPILERALDPPTKGPDAGGPPDITGPLDVQAAFMNFTISLYPERVVNVDAILGSTIDLLRKYFAKVEAQTRKLDGPAADKVVELLATPMKSLSLRVLEMEFYPALLGLLHFQTRKQVALSMVRALVDGDLALTSAEMLNSLFTFIMPLLRDEEDTPASEGEGATFAAEQQLVSRLVHHIRCDDTDLELQILTAARGFFGQGGPKRLAHTLTPVAYKALALVARIHDRESRAQAGEDVAPPQASVKKVFQFVHKTNTALKDANPEACLQLWLQAAVAADAADKLYGGEGSFEGICYEFLTQALLVFEEEVSDTASQYACIQRIVGTIMNITCLDEENFDTCAQKMTQYSARLLKKPMQCRSIATCAHLFWCDARKDGRRVLECIQKCLKITDAVSQSDSKNVVLWVEMLDKFLYFFEIGCPEVGAKYVQGLMDLCKEHIPFAENEPGSVNEAAYAKAHFQQTTTYISKMQRSADPDSAALFAEISLE